MNFFQQLAAQGNVDITLRILQKDDKLTVNVLPGSFNSKVKPLVFTGTAEDLDKEFFGFIMAEAQEVRGIESNVQDTKDELKQEKEEKDKKANKKKEAPKAKAADKKEKPAKEDKPEIEEPNLFVE